MNKYDLIVQDLKTDITIGTYPAYSRLPSVAQLCEHYEVSKITINKALEVLEQQGLIFRRKGSGTFVKKLEEGTQIKPSKKTVYIMGAFVAVAGIVGVSSYWNDIAYAVCDKIYPEADFGYGIQALDRLRHDVGGGVAQNVELFVLGAFGDRSVVIQDLHGNSPCTYDAADGLLPACGALASAPPQERGRCAVAARQ